MEKLLEKIEKAIQSYSSAIEITATAFNEDFQKAFGNRCSQQRLKQETSLLLPVMAQDLPELARAVIIYAELARTGLLADQYKP